MTTTSIHDNAHLFSLIEIPSPCEVPWSQMSGDHRSRFCQACSKRVFNLAAMRSDEALAMLTEQPGSVCVRIYRRRDGTVLTSDCQKGASALKWIYRRTAPATSMVAAAFAFAYIGGGAKAEVTGPQEQAISSQERVVYMRPDIVPSTFVTAGLPAIPFQFAHRKHHRHDEAVQVAQPPISETPPWEGLGSV
jgi:hypothetical protein